MAVPDTHSTPPPTPRPARPAPSPWILRAGGLAVAAAGLGIALSADARILLPSAEENDRVRGSRRAPVTLLEYSDFTCGYCVKFFQETWPVLFSKYVQTGKVRLVYRDFPRANSGPGMDTAMAARCAGEQGRYWAMHDRLFAGRQQFSPAQLRQHAKAIRLDIRRFAACVEESRYAEDIVAERRTANTLGFRGTPGFVVYVTDNPENAVAIPGAFPYETFEEEIDKLLAPASSSRRPPADAENAAGPIPARREM